MKKDIADSKKFQGQLVKNKYYDFETPYGYGGPLCDMKISLDSQKQFLKEIKEYCFQENIVAQFIRFHPVLNNSNILSDVIETKYMRQTIYIENKSPEYIMKNMESKNRNMVRKAVQNGIHIIQKPISEYEEFKLIYEETMEKDNATEYYFFQKNYFDELIYLKDYACIFYALKDEKIISGSIMLYNNQFMHYHLAGTHTEFRKYAPNNLLLYEAACWASRNNIPVFHLGGGLSEEDALFRFKKRFNKQGRLDFYIGRTIFNMEKYKDLCSLRKKIDIEFNENNNMMIQYRG